ncbi:hypothetical protein COCSUDRAFT_53591 [Coccomyxa subellipsoidea C-169]|uniref:Mog1p/PsbP-like protein n=1 Tax=Coccomyxa subellipsoidea (strain C-169) TaxID=574566 RepID=I0YW12_COCSC|nr:hypothetical protein COCSUDRAFT_53591 [Coccomyxa subellipsoidea C-169]EIE22581.1 hypothetical protein COCSUDRAFT_53591 [Coccomyxa subellipsoidea C-169]|eukprot:XP_005647125.1 hypothetical protein COCSUDRAFT_53591 [Coccomyxa subellipsoidea C-169]
MALTRYKALVFAAFLIATASGARQPLPPATAPALAPGSAMAPAGASIMPSPAPGPATQQQGYTGPGEADLLFVLVADKATFTTASTLVLSRPAHTVASFEAGGRAGSSPIAQFVSTAPGAPYVDSEGRWLNQPDALMKGTTGGHPADALLILSRPLYNETEQTLSYTVATLQVSPVDVKFPGGAVSERVQQAGAGMGAPLIQTAAPGMELTDVTLFIDMNRQAMQHPSA